MNNRPTSAWLIRFSNVSKRVDAKEANKGEIKPYRSPGKSLVAAQVASFDLTNLKIHTTISSIEFTTDLSLSNSRDELKFVAAVFGRKCHFFG
jgi:hypothetical protein